MEAGVGIEPTHKSFAGSCITTLLPSQLKTNILWKNKYNHQNQYYKFWLHFKIKENNNSQKLFDILGFKTPIDAFLQLYIR